MSRYFQLIILFGLLFHFNSKATFSIAAVDTLTGQVGVAGGSCIGGSDIIAGLVPGVGSMNSQASVCIPNYNLEEALIDMDAGLSVSEILSNRLSNDACGFGTFLDRQYVVTILTPNEDGARSAAFTGNNTLAFSGHRKGLDYALGGNILLDASVIEAMEEAFVNSNGQLSDRLMAAMQAAKIPGADSRCLDEGVSVLSTFIKVANPNDDPNDLFLDIVIPSTPYGVEPIDELQSAYDDWYATTFTPDPCIIDFCAEPVVFEAEDPVFDATDGSITLDNVTIGNVGCEQGYYKIGVSFYIYQLLPNGERIYQCTVNNPAPDNIVGNASIGFGAINICGAGDTNIGAVSASESNGFSYCDGAQYEIVGVIYSTELVGLDLANFTVFSQLPDEQYQVVAFGTLDINVSGDFPGGGQPLTTSSITEADTGIAGGVTVNCGENVTVYVEGLSRLSNCDPFDDISVGITSELSNELTMTIDDGEPIMIQSSTDGALGGQITGPNADDICYAGIRGNFVLDFASIDGLCEGSEIVLNLATTDLFTNDTVESSFTAVYSGAACAPCVTSINGNEADLISFTAFPNPANDFVMVQIREDNLNNYHLQLVDIAGRVINTYTQLQSIQKIELDGLKLNTGLYYLHLVNANSNIENTIPLIISD